MDASNDEEDRPRSLVTYTHEKLIDLIIENPGWSHKQYAAHFGRPTSWFSSILATDGFQWALDPRRMEIHDPSITATMEERLRGLALMSIESLKVRVNDKGTEAFVVAKAMEISTKALGLGFAGRHVGDSIAPAKPSLTDMAEDLARSARERRLSIQDVEVIDKEK